MPESARPIIEALRTAGALHRDVKNDRLIEWVSVVQLILTTRQEQFPTMDDVRAMVRQFVLRGVLADPTAHVDLAARLTAF